MSEIAIRREILSIAKGRVLVDYNRCGTSTLRWYEMFEDLPYIVERGRLEEVICLCDSLTTNDSFKGAREVDRGNELKKLEDSVRLLSLTAKSHELFLSMCKGEEYEHRK